MHGKHKQPEQKPPGAKAKLGGKSNSEVKVLVTTWFRNGWRAGTLIGPLKYEPRRTWFTCGPGSDQINQRGVLKAGLSGILGLGRQGAIKQKNSFGAPYLIPDSLKLERNQFSSRFLEMVTIQGRDSGTLISYPGL